MTIKSAFYTELQPDVYSVRLTFFLTSCAFSIWEQPVPLHWSLPIWRLPSLPGLLGPLELPPKELGQSVPETCQSLPAGNPRWQFWWSSSPPTIENSVISWLLCQRCPPCVRSHTGAALFTNSRSTSASSLALPITSCARNLSSTHSRNLWDSSFSAVLYFQQTAGKSKFLTRTSAKGWRSMLMHWKS